MAATYNFGMLTAGLPDLAQRQVSNPIMGEDYYTGQQNDWLKNWQGQWDAATPVYVSTGGGGWSGGDASGLQASVNASSGGSGWAADPTGSYSQGLISAAQGGDTGAQGIIGAFGGSYGSYSAPSGYYDDSARKALEAERDRQNAQYAAAVAGRQQNQQAQQTAYNESNGGGYTGGIINASYGAPTTSATSTTTDENGVPMPNTQPWGMPAYGGPTGANSQAGFGASGWGQDGAQPAGWGGPFTNKNPWAAS